MEKRHDDQLTAKLEEIITKGAVCITWAEIRQWYGIQRVAANTYRDLNQRWADLTKGKYGDILCVPISHGWPEKQGFWACSDKYCKSLQDLERGEI